MNVVNEQEIVTRSAFTGCGCVTTGSCFGHVSGSLTAAVSKHEIKSIGLRASFDCFGFLLPHGIECRVVPTGGESSMATISCSSCIFHNRLWYTMRKPQKLTEAIFNWDNFHSCHCDTFARVYYRNTRSRARIRAADIAHAVTFQCWFAAPWTMFF